ncbi:MAG: hypothetical protein AB8B82_07805 [Roseovarius sp.]
MTVKRLALALGLAVLAGGGIASVALKPSPETTAQPEYECTTCDARAAGKKRLREALQAQSAEEE